MVGLPEIRVVSYDPTWPDSFALLRATVWPAVSRVALRIDHVGSTAVPGLAAKPIIDMDVVVADEPRVVEAIAALASIGYRWIGDLGVVGREAFRAPVEPFSSEHHLYVVVENNKAHLDHVLLRDLLRSDPVARRRYESLKRKNARRARGDLNVYTASKAGLVAELLTRARAERRLPAAEYWVPTPSELPAEDQLSSATTGCRSSVDEGLAARRWMNP